MNLLYFVFKVVSVLRHGSHNDSTESDMWHFCSVPNGIY